LIFSNLCLLAFTAAVAAEGDCYKNKPGPAPNYIGSSDSMVPAECNKKCADKNYSYFGVRWSDECWCGNEAPNPSLKLEKTKCYKICSGNPMLACGGAYEANVWKVCKETDCKFSGSEIDVNRFKEMYIGLDRNDEDKYLKEVKRLLPLLLAANALSSPDEVGIAKVVNGQTKYPLALLTGNDVNLVKSKSKVESINGTVTTKIGKKNFEWYNKRATGFYAAPGELVTVTIPKDLVRKIGIEIGQDKYWIRTKFQRETQKFASPFGGPISVSLFDKAATTEKGMFDITVDNAVMAPYFVHGQTTNEEWETMKKSSAPWAVLRVPGQIYIHAETQKLKKVPDMSSVMSSVKKTMDEYEIMMGLPAGSQPGEERIHFDPYCHYGGYTVDLVGRNGHMCRGGGSSVIHPAFTYEIWENFGDAIAGHEIGHRGCHSDLPNMGMQWTAEVVRHYLDVKRGFVNWDRWAIPFSVLQKMVGFKTFSKGKPCYEAFGSSHFPKGIRYKVTSYENCWTILYRLPLLEFGVDIWRKVLTANANLPDITWSEFNVQTERLVDLYCNATQHNLLPLFQFFNIQVDKEIQDRCKALPAPKILSGYLKVANCLSDDKTPDSECAKMPEFPDHEGLCLISGRCANDNTVMHKTVDLYGKNKTRDTEDACLARATEIFKECENGLGTPITATYLKKDGSSSSNSYPLVGKCYTDSSSCRKNIDCLASVDGVAYIGKKNTTKSGRTCQRWGAQSPHRHCVGRGLAGNYCRNPDGEPTTWCYTTDPDKRWELCDVELCKPATCYLDMSSCTPDVDCLTSTKGKKYKGKVNLTVTGRTCQRWDSQTPHTHRHKTLEENYCRNPENEPTVWCYTTDPNKRWELCAVDLCKPGSG